MRHFVFQLIDYKGCNFIAFILFNHPAWGIVMKPCEMAVKRLSKPTLKTAHVPSKKSKQVGNATDVAPNRGWCVFRWE